MCLFFAFLSFVLSSRICRIINWAILTARVFLSILGISCRSRFFLKKGGEGGGGVLGF